MSILIFFPILVLGLQDEPTYVNEELKISVTVPGEDFEVKSYEQPSKGELWGWTSTLFEFRNPELLLHGILLYSKAAMRAERYADWRERQWKQHNKDVKRVNEREIEGKQGTWLVREWWLETEDNEFHYVHLFINDGRNNIEFLLWSPDAVWEDNQELAWKILDSFQYGDATLEKKAEPETPRP
jgi:hypothetical protein